MAGRWTDITWQGRSARAWVPDGVSHDDFEVPVLVARRTEQAGAAVRRADERLPGAWEPIVRMLLRSEGIASSDIEGIRAPIEDVVLAEIDDDVADDTAAWIADNLAVVKSAIRAAGRTSLSVSVLNRWHRRLMRHSPLPARLKGRFRDAQGWIGGTSPLDAVYVPPPAPLIGNLMTDLVEFANRDDLDPVTHAALLHAQFETIHPYADGNGRIGRVLISWILARRLAVSLPPPVSVLIARDPGGYLSGLLRYREGEPDAFVNWFADIVTRAGNASVVLGEQIDELLAGWARTVDALRADAVARRLVNLLPEQPVLNAAIVATRLGVSERAARGALGSLADRGILQPVRAPGSHAGRPRSWWSASDLLDLVVGWAG